MKAVLERHKLLWGRGAFLLGVVGGVLLLALGMVATYYANFYSTIRASNSVTDIILDNVPVMNVDFIFNEGTFIFIAVLAFLLLLEPRRIPFVLKAAGLFIIIRSVFMILTHLAPPPYESYLDASKLISKFSSGNDLFFSGHTGMPFLMALIFWQSRFWRYLLLFFTAAGGAGVLLGHLHYSIDVFSALFISYGIFHIARKAFRKDYDLFRGTT